MEGLSAFSSTRELAVRTTAADTSNRALVSAKQREDGRRTATNQPAQHHLRGGRDDPGCLGITLTTSNRPASVHATLNYTD
jgi:hypothetical protein